MSVYVDPIMPTLKSKRWPYYKGCHMFADTEYELHRLAEDIGLKRSWFQNREDMPHYDLVPGVRAKAIRYGAIEVSAAFMVEMLQARRKARHEKTQ